MNFPNDYLLAIELNCYHHATLIQPSILLKFQRDVFVIISFILYPFNKIYNKLCYCKIFMRMWFDEISWHTCVMYTHLSTLGWGSGYRIEPILSQFFITFQKILHFSHPQVFAHVNVCSANCTTYTLDWIELGSELLAANSNLMFTHIDLILLARTEKNSNWKVNFSAQMRYSDPNDFRGKSEK